MIEVMMKVNEFDHAHEIPKEVASASAPFEGDGEKEDVASREYRARLPERKEWQKPLPTQEAKDIFKPVPKG